MTPRESTSIATEYTMTLIAREAREGRIHHLPAFNTVPCAKCGRAGSLAASLWQRTDQDWALCNNTPDPLNLPVEVMLRTCDCGFSWLELPRDTNRHQ